MNTVVLEVRSLQETMADAARAMKTRRAAGEARISFATPELLWRVLTAKRWEILKALCDVGPVSIGEAARRVGRDVQAVHRDVTGLLHAAVLGREPDGLRQQSRKGAPDDVPLANHDLSAPGRSPGPEQC